MSDFSKCKCVTHGIGCDLERIQSLESELKRKKEALEKIGNDDNVSSCWNCDEGYRDGPAHYERCGKRIAQKALAKTKEVLE